MTGDELTASASGTGLSSSTEPKVSALRASIPDADTFIRKALEAEISVMLVELGNPLLVDRIFPGGWRDADRAALFNLYELCRRTFAKRENVDG